METPVQLPAVTSGNDLQMITLDQAKQWYNSFANYSKSILKEGLDYGTIKGTPKPTLYKAGAEKLRLAYNLSVEMDMVDKTLDLNTPFVDYTYKCRIRSRSGQLLSECEGSCNTFEGKFRYVWVSINDLPEGTDITTAKSERRGKKVSEFEFAINKAETSGQYGKPAEYWEEWKAAIKEGRATRVVKESKNKKPLDAWERDDTQPYYRINNPEAVALKNTIMKMAQKRAFVGAMLIATGASEFFSQDLDDLVEEEVVIAAAAEVAPVRATAATGGQITPEPVETYAGNWPSPDGDIIDEKGKAEQALQLWRDEVEKCANLGELMSLFNGNTKIIMDWPELKEIFSAKRATFPQPKKQPQPIRQQDPAPAEEQPPTGWRPLNVPGF